MEKLIFDTDEGTEEFYIIEQTRVNGKSYILVTKEEDAEDPEVIILRDDSRDTDKESLYVAVEDDDELEAIAKVFEVLLDEEDTEAE